MKYSLPQKALAAATLFISTTSALDISTDNEGSIRDVAANVAHGLMSYYTNNQTGVDPAMVGSFPDPPIYWWNSGAIWGGMVDYVSYTGDQSYTDTIKQALAANIGENGDLIIEAKRGQEGTDDQAFWALTMMNAAEADFPAEGPKSWVDVADGAFKSITSRWDTKDCGGGFFWQIYPENFHGLDYKNSVANGGLFQLAARLAYLKKDDSYLEWAVKVWDWERSVGFITDNYEVYDGAGIENGANCTQIDKTQWTYNAGMFTYGAAVMYAHTGEQVWLERTQGLVKNAGQFFNHHPDRPNVLTEVACESRNCNMDQQSFKAYLARWLAKTSALVPETQDTIKPWLEASAKAAAGSCSGPNDACGQKWYVDGFDQLTGANQQLCAMETIQSLLVSTGKMFGGNVPTPPETGDSPESSSVPVSESAPAPESSVVPSSAAPSSAVETSAVESSTVVAPTAIESSAAESTVVAPTAIEVPSSSPPLETALPVCEEPIVVTVTMTESSAPPPPEVTDAAVTSICEVPVVVTVTETGPAGPPTPVTPIGVHESSTLRPSIPIVTGTPSTPTPSPPAFTGAASRSHVGGAAFAGFGSLIAAAMFL